MRHGFYFLLLTLSIPAYTLSASALGCLEREIEYLSKKGDELKQKKSALYKQGLDRFIDQQCKLSLTVCRLETEKFSVDSLDYFQEEFAFQHDLCLEVTDQYYDYAISEGCHDYWIDFANTKLGGGCFTHGFVQEEIMVVEMPDLANHIACHSAKITTRAGGVNVDEALKADPNPYLMLGLHRVQAVDVKCAYGSKKLNQIPVNDLISTTRAVVPVQVVNVLALAAPRLDKPDLELQWDMNTLCDIFNTLMAGFSLVKQIDDGDFIIHSGKLGCGAFHNSPKAVFLLHCLAAQHLNIQLKLHGYSEREAGEYAKIWQIIYPQFENVTLYDALKIIQQARNL